MLVDWPWLLAPFLSSTVLSSFFLYVGCVRLGYVH